MRKKVEIVTYIFLAIGISPLSSSIYGHNIKLPFLFIGIILLWKTNAGMRRIINHSLGQQKMKLMIALLIVMAAIGTVTGGFNVLPVLLDFMAIFFFFLFFWEKSRNEIDTQLLYRFVERYFIAITIYELVVIISGISESAAVDEVRVINLAVCPFALSMLYLNRGKTLLSLLFIAICVYMTIRGAMRINFLFPILYVVFLLFTTFSNKNVSLFKKALTVGIIAAAVVSIYPIVQAYIEADGSRYLHMVKRTEEMFDEDTRDDTRENTNMLIINEMSDFILPQGIGYANHTPRIMSLYRSRYGVMSTMDSNLLYCVYHFGLLIGLGIIIMIFYQGIKIFAMSTRHLGNSNIFMAACFVLTVLFMFALKSWIFVYSSFGLTYGLLYAYAHNLIRNNRSSNA